MSPSPRGNKNMLREPFHHALVLTGPTGSGKSAFAMELAEALDAEIVSMDSMALYRGLDIGTAKPTSADRARVRHHLIDVLDPWESGSAASWLAQAAICCRDIERRGKQMLIVGGTPLYLKALMYGLFDGPPGDQVLRQRLAEEQHTIGATALHQRLAAVDPASAQRLHPNDHRRVVRALEVWELTGKPLSAWQTQWPGEAPGVVVAEAMRPQILWLDVPREQLYTRIDRRVVEMFEAGFVDEVRGLLRLPEPLGREAAQALGYRQVIEALRAGQTQEEMIATVQTRTRNFAKRQITWFRHLPGCRGATKELTRTLWKPTI
jgi:tRNA dimethylallyltransferase